MSDQAPVVAIANAFPASFTPALNDTRLFPVIEANWPKAFAAVQQVQPSAVVACASQADLPRLQELAETLANNEPYTPLIVVDPDFPLPINAIPFYQDRSDINRLGPRLRSALRVRTLHSTVLRRNAGLQHLALHMPDPVEDVTVLLLGRGANYPALSVAFGERTGVVGALSIEAAAKQLNTRDVDGIAIGSGISTRVTDAFLTVLSEDARFRHLPVIVTDPSVQLTEALPNLELVQGEPNDIANNAMPLFRQQALASRLARALTSLDNNGLIDVRTGLLTQEAFERDFATTIYQTQARGGGLSAVRLSFEEVPERLLFNAARIATRLLRTSDFGTVCSDGSILIVLTEVDMRNAHMIARRLSSVVKHTSLEGLRKRNMEPHISVTTMMPDDQMRSILERLHIRSSQLAAS